MKEQLISLFQFLEGAIKGYVKSTESGRLYIFQFLEGAIKGYSLTGNPVQ